MGKFDFSLVDKHWKEKEKERERETNIYSGLSDEELHVLAKEANQNYQKAMDNFFSDILNEEFGKELNKSRKNALNIVKEVIRRSRD